MSNQEYVVVASKLTKRYAQFALQDINLRIPKGYITGLIGPNGAGKSTLIKLLMGVLLPHQGEVRIFGETLLQQETQIKDRIGYVSDESYYYEHLTIRQLHRVIRPFYKQWDEQAFNEYLERFSLSPKAKIRNLSKGMKMKLSLAFALSHHAELLIMDEPTAGLDPVFRRELLELLADLMLDGRLTVLFSTHITTDLDRIADYIAFVDRGQLIFHDTKEEIMDRYTLVKGDVALLDRDTRRGFIGLRETGIGFEGLTADRQGAVTLFGEHAHFERPTLEDIMYFTAKGGAPYASART